MVVHISGCSGQRLQICSQSVNRKGLAHRKTMAQHAYPSQRLCKSGMEMILLMVDCKLPGIEWATSPHWGFNLGLTFSLGPTRAGSMPGKQPAGQEHTCTFRWTSACGVAADSSALDTIPSKIKSNFPLGLQHRCGSPQSEVHWHGQSCAEWSAPDASSQAEHQLCGDPLCQVSLETPAGLLQEHVTFCASHLYTPQCRCGALTWS